MTLEPQPSTDVRREISRRSVALLKEYIGRGPTTARTMISGDIAAVIFTDTLTKGEKVLAKEEELELVREMRRTFLRTMRPEIEAIIEEETGREVLTLLGDHAVNPDYAFLACLLVPEPNGDGANGDGQQAGNGSGRDDSAAGRDQQRQITRGMVGLYKEFIGRGPTDARTYIDGNFVATVLGDTLTKAERTLADDERPKSVREIRRQFQGALKKRACEIVTEATGREIDAFLSDHSIDPDYAIEVFVLADAGEDGDEDPDGP